MKKVLVIDDDSAILSIIEKYFKKLFPNIILLKTTKGKEGVEIALTEIPNAVIVDIFMPDMDGYEVCEKIKNNTGTNHIPVLFLSSVNNIAENKEKAIEKGADAFLSKPIDRLELTLQVRAMLKINEANIQSRNEKKRLQEQVEEQTKKLKKELVKRREIEKDLRESEKKYRFLVENQNDLVVRFDKDQKFLFVNPNYCKIFGVKESEIIGNNFFPLIHEDDVAHVKQSINKLKTPPHTAYHEERAKTVKGLRWFGWSLKAVVNDKNEIIETVGVGRDITDRKQTERLLHESEEKFRKISGISSDYAYCCSLQEKGQAALEWHLGAFQQITGYPPSETLSADDIIKLVHSDDLVKIEKRNAKLNRGKTVITELRIITKSGDVKWIREKSVPEWDSTKQKVIRIVSSVQDITERKKEEQKHREIEEKFMIFMENIPFGVFAHDLNGDFIFVNSAAEKLSGYSMKELLRSNVCDIDKESSRKELEIIWKDLQSGGIKKIITTHCRKDGKNYPVEINLTSINFKDENIFIGIAQDITEREKAQQILKENELKLKELNATKDKFFSIIAHDLKAPFSGILGFSNLLYEKSKAGDFKNVVRMTELLNKAATQSFELLNNLLEWSRTQTGKKEFKPEKINVCDVLGKTMNLMTLAIEDKELNVEINCPEKIEIFADPNMLKTIFRNLLSNAIKFSYLNGTLKILVIEKDNEFQITVGDNGKGISRELQNKLFQVGENVVTPGTNDERGTGLGLILCKEFVEMHGGRIWVESSPGAGAIFGFSIPKI